MQILFLCNYYPPQHFGGYEELCQDVAIGLRERGHRVTVLTSHPRTGSTGAAVDEPDVVRALEPKVAIGDPLATPRLILGLRGRGKRNRRRLAEVLAQVQPEIAVVWAMWNLSPDIAAGLEKALGQHVLYYIADYWPTLPEAITQHLGTPSRRPVSRLAKRMLATWLSKPGRRLADGLQLNQVACVSQAVLAALRDAQVPMGHATVIHNGIDPAQFRPTDRLQDASPLRLLLAGRLSEDKGVFVAVEALALARAAGYDVHLSLIGAGDAAVEAELHRRIDISGLQGQVIWMGRLPRDRMPAAIADHDVLLVPSLWPDPLPRSAQEGMAAGLVVIASRLGGLPELIDDGQTGLLVHPGNAAALAEAIGRLATDSVLRLRLAQAGRDRIAAEFDIRMTVERIERRLLSMSEA